MSSLNKAPSHPKPTLLTKLIALIISGVPIHAQCAKIVAPNLMVIFGNSATMNKTLESDSYPAPITPLHFNDKAGLQNEGSAYLQSLYGDQPSSKLYISKQALTKVLSSNAANNINFGFATFRQTFGMEVAVTQHYTRGTRPILEADDATVLLNGTPEQKSIYGKNPKNFKALDWYRIYLTHRNRYAKLGKNIYDFEKDVFDDSKTTYMTGIHNGLPTKIVYKTGTAPACNIKSWGDLSPDCNPLTNATTTIHDQTYTDSSYGIKTVFNASGATGNLYTVKANNKLVNWRLCNTYFNSQNNSFHGFYLADKDIIDVYPLLSSYNPISYIDWDSAKFDKLGILIKTSKTVACTGDGTDTGSFTGSYRELNKRITNKVKTPGQPQIYFSGIANYYSGLSSSQLALNPGVLSGWSGETTYTETDQNNATGFTKATYPSGAANPNRQDRQLISKGWQQTNATHMGVFLDLPNPNSGYIDRRGLIKSYLRLKQMDQSGKDYNPAKSHIISNGKGIAASTFSSDVNNNQAPIYDTLQSALAYYKSYKTKDPYQKCRSNNILLLIDGSESGHWTNNASTKQFLSPVDMAAQLKAMGIKTYVVTLSKIPGEKADADAIAAAGGTQAAYKANSASALVNSFSAVLSVLPQAVLSGLPPADTCI